MNDLYDTIAGLLSEKGITGYKMCQDLRMSRSFMTELKKGRVKSMKAETAQMVADYFGVSVDYLLTGEEKENPAISGGGKVYTSGIKFTVDNPIGFLWGIYGKPPSSVMGKLLDVSAERAERFVLGTEKPDDAVLKTAANVFDIPYSDLKAGNMMAETKPNVYLFVLSVKHDRYPEKP